LIVKAIVLSAGQGRRLMPLTASTPKCCLQIEGRTLLEWQIDALAAAGIDEVVVVTGFGHRVVEAVTGRMQNIKVRSLYNPFYALSDNLGTCWVAREEMRQAFVLLNGDTLFEPAVLTRLLANGGTAPITLASDCKSAYDDDDMKIIAAGARLQRVGKQLDLRQVNGESIGMLLFTTEGARLFVQKVEQLMSGPEGLARWYLSAIDELACLGQVGICSIHGLSWCEVDVPQDLADAERTVAAWNIQPSNSAAPGLPDGLPIPF
jgi:choline kinase